MVNAQTKNVMSGRLVDENGNPVEFANIILKAAASSITVDGGISDENGAFTFNLEEGQYILEASSIGYVTLTIVCSPRELGELTMPKDVEQLEGATVNASRTTVKGGQYIVVPDEKEAKASAKGIDLLAMQQLPGLSVDRALQSIKIDGGTPVLKINGKEVNITRLANLNPEHIKRIEYSNNPGIQYLDRGAAGVINIVLKEAEDGGSLVGSAESAFSTWFINSYHMGTYHKGKSEFGVEYNISHRNYKEDPAVLDDKYIDSERNVERHLKMNNPFHYTTHNITGEYTYMPNDSTMFIASLKESYYGQERSAAGNCDITDRGIAYIINSSREGKVRQNHPSLDLFYSMNLPSAQKIEFNVVGEYNSEDVLQIENQDYPDGMATFDNSVKNSGWAISAEGVYNKRFNSVSTRWGVQYQYNFAKNNYYPYGIISTMTKNNTYIYAQADGAFGENASWMIGTGAKIFSVNNGTDRKTYVRNLSSAQINWKMSKNWSLNVSSNFNPSLPSLGDLSDVLQKNDYIEGVQGNPDLKPSSSLNNRLVIRYNGDKGMFLTLGAGYLHTFSPIISTFSYVPDYDLFIGTPQNATFSNRLYTGFEFGFKEIFNHFNIKYSGTYKREESKGDSFDHIYNNYWSQIDFQGVWEKFLFGCYFTITPEWTLNGEILRSSERGQNIYAQYNWKNVTLGVNWHCPFNKKGYMYGAKNLSEIHTAEQYNWTVENGNMIVVSLSWNFDFGKSFNKGNKTLWNGGYDSGTVQ